MHTQTMDQTQTAPPMGQHSILLVTAEMSDSGGQAYNYIVFRDHTGEDKVMMNGLALKRNNSDIRALRGVMAPPSEAGLPQGQFTEVSRVELFRGDVKDYLRKMKAATDALQYINAQNLSYFPEDQSSDTPNSIANALVEAMDLEFPEEAKAFWAPGHDNKLLSDNWRH